MHDKIFYEADAVFHLSPHSSLDLISDQLQALRDTYAATGQCFFFTLENNAIVVDNTVENSSSDIFHQLSLIANCIWSTNSTLEGSICFRIGNNIEYIAADHRHTVLSHCIMFDLLTEMPEEQILAVAKAKMLQHIDAGQTELLARLQATENNYTYLTKKLSAIESQITVLTDINNFLWEACMAMGLFSVGCVVISTL